LSSQLIVGAVPQHFRLRFALTENARSLQCVMLARLMLAQASRTTYN
jgi:hypothetical protein